MKLLALLLTALLAFSATACQKETPPNTSMEFNAETDHPFYMNTLGQSQIVESPEGFYYLQENENGRSFLRFIDKETLEDTIVCAKPNCLHEDQTDVSQCNAQFRLQHGIHYYKGKLYVVTAEPDPINLTYIYKLVEISLDGTQRKTVWEIDWKTSDSLPRIFLNIIHRGKLYFEVINKDNSTFSPTYIYAYDIDTKKCTLVQDNLTGVSDFFAVGDYLYIKAYNEEAGDYAFFRYTISTEELISMPQIQTVLRYKTGINNMISYTSTTYDYDLKVENPKKVDMQVDIFRAVNEKYFCEQDRTITHKESGKIVSIEEYDKETGASRANATEEEYAEYMKQAEAYEIVWSDYLNIYDAETLTLLGTLDYSDTWTYTLYIKDDLLIRYDSFNGFAQIDLSKIGTDQFVWATPSKIN